MTQTKKVKHETVTLPKARLMVEHVWEKDAYTDPRTQKAGTPKYKVEVAIEDTKANREYIEDILAEAAVAEWGEAAYDEYFDGDIRDCMIEGDKLAKKREQKGKPGDAYKGMIVIRADTAFNADGQDAPGGIAVFDEEVKRLTLDRRGELYPGCFVEIGVEPSGYLDNAGDRALKFYLKAVQKVGDGEKLISSADHSKLFKPVERAEGERRERRRRRD